jgi:hypothetical protein
MTLQTPGLVLQYCGATGFGSSFASSMTTIKNTHNAKLAPRYYSPFEVLERIGFVAYHLSY